MNRESPRDTQALPNALRSLAALLRAGLPLSAAITSWPSQCPGELATPVACAARRVALGDSAAGALDAMSPWVGNDAATVAAIARLHAVAGCDAARLLDATARTVERRNALSRTAAAATAGAKLSGRLVAALPVMVLPLVPAAGGSLFDKRGSLLLICGGLLLLVGAWWITRLLPRPPQRDEVGELAAFVSSAVSGGVGLHDALVLCCDTVGASLRAEMSSCMRRVRLGADWATALSLASDDGLRAMAGVLRRAEGIGSPPAHSLDVFAGRRRDEAEAAFDKATRRAPVLMILPLTICILPAYVVLAVGPILRGLSFA